MSNNDQITMLYNEISRQNTWYMWTVGILVTVIFGLAGFIYFVQFKLSQKEIEEVKVKLVHEYGLDKLESRHLAKANSLLIPFNAIISLRPEHYSVEDTALLFECISSLRQIKMLKEDTPLYNDLTTVPLACWMILASLSLKLKRTTFVYEAAKQMQELVKELYPKSVDYNNQIEIQVRSFAIEHS